MDALRQIAKKTDWDYFNHKGIKKSIFVINILFCSLEKTPVLDDSHY